MLSTLFCYSVVVATLLSFSILALYLKSRMPLHHSETNSVEFFITARKTQGTWRIGWSFFAGAMGSWAIIGPPNFACTAGPIGLFMYALSSGMPIFVIALFGDVIQSRWPDCRCLGDFIDYRFGPSFKKFVIVLLLFSMSVAMAAEFTAMGSLFEDFVLSVNYPIILIIGILTTAYTSYGGLQISIITDQFQALTSILLIAFLGTYLAAYFRRERSPTASEDKIFGPNAAGYASIFVMPVCLMSSTVFSEAIWQRVWAAESQRALHLGGLIGSISVTLAVLFFGSCGLLAAWSGLIVFDSGQDSTNPNLYLFQVFKSSSAEAAEHDPLGIVILVLAAVMSMGAVDSLQNGISATISSQFLRTDSLWSARLVVVFITVPIVWISTFDLQVLMLLMVPNMLCTCCFIPVLLGAWDSPMGKEIITESSALFACVTAMLATTLFGIASTGSISEGIYMAWYANGYALEYFLAATSSSLGALGFYMLLSQTRAKFVMYYLKKATAANDTLKIATPNTHGGKSREVVLVQSHHRITLGDDIPFLESSHD